METHNVELLQKKELTSDVVELVLSRPQNFSFKAGQFITLHIQIGEKSRWRSYSIFSSPDEEHLRLCIKVVPEGFASSHFEVVEEGYTYKMRGPLGNFTVDHDTNNHVFISTGTGIAPLNSMVQTLSEKDNATFLHGVRTKKDLITPDTYKDSDIEYIPVLSRENWKGKTGYVQEHIPIQEKTTYYICGLRDLVLETDALLQKQGIPSKHIKYERYS